jgi:triosephosphate isomerase
LTPMTASPNPRRLMAVGNWKMHKTATEAAAFARELAAAAASVSGVEVWIAPSFTSLHPVARVLRGTSLRLAAQDLFWEAEGAHTGEVSAAQLTDAGCGGVLIGHSERRRHFHETDETVLRKTRAALLAGLTPIVCVGESLEEREAGRTAERLETQIARGLKEISVEEGRSIVIAYEPVWAIGTGRVATPDQIAESHRLIRKKISGMLGGAAEAVPILYGGSVTPENVAEIAKLEDVDGVLVGGASLKIDSFMKIVRAFARRASGE